jgi:hypothetical protein
VHPMQGDEIRALRRLQRDQEASPYVFTSERGRSDVAKSFGTLFERLGKRAGIAENPIKRSAIPIAIRLHGHLYGAAACDSNLVVLSFLLPLVALLRRCGVTSCSSFLCRGQRI